MKTFSTWSEERVLRELTQIEPIHVAAYIKELGQHRAAPTVKQHLAALGMLFDWAGDWACAADQSSGCGTGPQARRPAKERRLFCPPTRSDSYWNRLKSRR